MRTSALALASFTLAIMGCSPAKKPNQGKADTVKIANTESVDLPAPYATKSTKAYCDVIGWPAGKTPAAPKGFNVNLYADGLTNPRNIYVAPNGDVFVSEANTVAKGIKKIGANVLGISKSQYLGDSKNDIVIFRENKSTGKPEKIGVFLSDLKQPYGMLIWDNYFYAACTGGIWRYPYHTGQTEIKDKGILIKTLPAGGYNNHWTRNIIANAAHTKIFVSVGSGSNVAEHGMQNEKRRADILEMNPDGSGERIYASGLRNPAGISINPVTKQLWSAVNERDELGDELVPDYLTSVKDGGFYGWPYSYFGSHPDPRIQVQRPGMVAKSIVPDVSLGAHTASLGLTFYTGQSFPARYKNGAFIGQHGSWNRSVLTGYKVVFVPFINGKPGKPEDFLTGFIADIQNRKVFGRPVGVAVAKDGSLLVADDTSNKIWRVSAAQ